ncbi:lipoprotein YmcC precursor [Photobacterium angustum]|uniref:YjbF family lipoprotein n=1 Tax=Photobacterium angustum TaxID=661 RepID=UPI0005E33D11|nr:YjbF family lipoprotein [Photobacterium angustum]KJF92730.1 lipoprotein YmcC precursor [Photobacterium angustum]KJG07207.1 lipoprotein YmcC precursor [Photobacterium angustum]PSV90431.1 YjbF family lipoprotein [Photobacterium angustum]PSW83160.1 YjbF family lipoprotein [Photobacterium angustum]
MQTYFILRPIYLLILLFNIVFIATGCSQKISNVKDTVELAIYGTPDITKSRYEIAQIPYASTYAKIGDHNQIFMILALAEPVLDNTKSSATQLKWLSSDNGMIVTEHGRIVKTVNLPDGNLVNTYSEKPDPLSLGLQLSSTPTHWQRTIDWQPGYHSGYTLNSVFTYKKPETLYVNGKYHATLKFIETVQVKELNTSYLNMFWIEQTTGNVVKSRQIIAPSLPSIELTPLKPFAQ